MRVQPTKTSVAFSSSAITQLIAVCAAFMKKYDGEKYSGSNRYYLYDLAYKIFDYLALKTKIAENLVPA